MSNVRLAPMAWRNLWRNRRRTIIGMVSMAFGILLATVSTGVGEGSYREMIDYAARLGSGHVTIQHPKALELPGPGRTVPDASEHLSRARNQLGVAHVVERVSGTTMLSTARGLRGAAFIAIDPSAEASGTLQILGSIAEGRGFESPDEQGIILGAVLAEQLGTSLGKKVVYTMTDKDGEIVSGLTRVTGLIRGGATSVDAGLCLLPIGSVRRTLGYGPREVTQVAVFLDDQDQSEAVRARLREVSGEEVAVLRWDEVLPDLAGFVEIKRSGNLVFEILLLALLGAGIFNTMFVSVMERLREFGIMRALGFSPVQIFRLVIYEAAFMGVLGVLAGIAATAYPYWYLSTTGFDTSAIVPEGTEVAGVAMSPVLYAAIGMHEILVIGGVTVAACLTAGLYPAWRAGRVAPVEVIKLV